jgi:hypothetical protein
MLVSTVAQAETKVSGYFETNFRSTSNDVSTTNSPEAAFGTEMDINLKSKNELDNGMTMGIKIGTTSEQGDASKTWGTDSYEISLTSGDTKVALSTDTGATLDMISDVVPNPVDQPIDNHGKIGGTSFGGKGAPAGTTDIQDATNINLTQKFDSGKIAVAYMPSDGNQEEADSGFLNNDQDTKSGYSIAGQFEVMDGLKVSAGMEKKQGFEKTDAQSQTIGASYTTGALSAGVQKTNNDVGVAGTSENPDVDISSIHYGVMYKVSDALSVGIAIQKADKSSAANDEEYQQIEAAYSLGALGIGVSYGQVENVNGTADKDADQLMIRLSSKM